MLIPDGDSMLVEKVHLRNFELKTEFAVFGEKRRATTVHIMVVLLRISIDVVFNHSFLIVQLLSHWVSQ